MRTSDAIAEFIEHCELRNLAEPTIDIYRWGLSKLSDLADVPTSPAVLRRLVADCDLADESRFDVWRILRMFYRWLDSHQLVENVMEDVDRPVVPSRFPRTLTIDEIANMFDACQDQRDSAMMSVLLDTGIRVGELANLTWAEITSEGARVRGKTGMRFVPVTDHVSRLLNGMGDETHVWIGRHGPLTLNGVKQAIRRVMYRAGIRPPKAGPHTLRHTFGLLYVKHGGDPFSLQRVMGHTSIESTMLYVQMHSQDLIDQYVRFAPSTHIQFPETRG